MRTLIASVRRPRLEPRAGRRRRGPALSRPPETSDFLASPAAETSEGRRILEHVRETWGERFGLTAGG